MLHKIYGSIGLAMAIVIGALFIQINGLKSSIEDKDQTIGRHEVTIASQEEKIEQFVQTIGEKEQQIQSMLEQKKLDDELLANNKKTIQALQRENTHKTTQIGKLKNENKGIRDYLHTIVDDAIIRLFRQQPAQNYYYDENGICHTTGGVDGGNACPVYKTESIVNYALDLETALDSCNADKASMRDWAANLIQPTG